MGTAFVSQLLRVRRLHNLTQVGLAHVIKVDPMCVSRWERGTNLPGRESWERLQELYPEIFTGHPPRGVAMLARRKQAAPGEAVKAPKSKLRGPKRPKRKAKAGTKLVSPMSEIGKAAQAAENDAVVVADNDAGSSVAENDTAHDAAPSSDEVA